jgi:hypothetical protein
MLSIFDVFDSSEFRSFIKDNIIQYNVVNGVKVVSDLFIQETIDVDPIDLMEKFYKSFYKRSPSNLSGVDSHESSIRSSIIITQIKRAIKDEVAKLTQDVSFGGKFIEYKKCFEMLGFVEVSRQIYSVNSDGYFESKESMFEFAKENNYKIIQSTVENDIHDSKSEGVYADYISEESEVFFWHYDHSMIIQMDSHGMSANSITLYCNGVLRNGCSRFEGLNLIPCTNVWELKRDLRILPAFQIQEILKKFKPCSYMLTFSESLYSYLTHKDFKILGNELWEKSKVEKINRLPDDIKSFLLEKNSYIDKKMVGFHRSCYPNSVHSKVSLISEKMSDELRLNLSICDYFFDLKFSDNWFKIFNHEVLSLTSEHELSFDDIENFGSIIYERIKIKTFDISFKQKISYLTSLSKSELDYLIENKKSYGIIYDDDYSQLVDIAKSLNGSIVLNS